MERSNLFYRIISAVILVPLAILIIFRAHIFVIFSLLFLITVGAVVEFSKIIKFKTREKVFLLLTSSTTLFFNAYNCFQYQSYYWATLFVVTAVYVLFTEGYDNYVTVVGKCFFCNLYIPFLLSFSYRLLYLEKGREWLFFLLLTNWATDSFAYFIGVNFGKHKLTTISPKKSVEGLLGGVLGAVFSAILVNAFLFKSNKWVFFVLMGLAGALFGQLGDLVESGIKRNEGVKDSGTIIPGHGGFLDRFDSLIFTGFLFYIFANLKAL